MGVVVLNPRDPLRHDSSYRHHLILPPPHPPRVKRRRKRNGPNSNGRNRARTNSRKRSLNTSPCSRAAIDAEEQSLVKNHVKILKRGEQLAKTMPETVFQSAEVAKTEGLYLGPTRCLFSDHELVPTQIRLIDSKVNGFYAGSAFRTSPPPNSLPFPVFFMKNCFIGVKNVDSYQ